MPAAPWPSFATELGVTLAMVLIIGKRAFDRRTVVGLAKPALVFVAVVGVDRLLLTLGQSRIILDALAYCLLFALLRALPLREPLDFAAFRRNRPA